MNKVRTIPVSLVSAMNQKKVINTSDYVLKSKAFHNLKPQNGEKVLDIGCRDGSVTLQIKNLGCKVLGIDINPVMIEAARQKGVEALLMDAEDMFFDKEFDAVFSLSALHWMRHPNLVLEAINRALKLGGRFVAEMSAHGNLQEIFDAFLDIFAEDDKSALYLIPWYLPTEEDYKLRLEQKGFSVKSITTTKKSFGISGSLSTFVQSFVPIFSELIDNKQEFIDKVVTRLENKLEKKSDRYQINYVSIDFIAIKEKEIV